MASPRHQASKKNPPLPRALLRLGLTLSAAGALAAAGAGMASAAPPGADHAVDTGQSPGEILVTQLENTADLTVGPMKRLPLYPLARTGVDPLNNSVGTQVADFAPVSTQPATQPVSNGGSLESLPVVGAATRLLPG